MCVHFYVYTVYAVNTYSVGVVCACAYSDVCICSVWCEEYVFMTKVT